MFSDNFLDGYLAAGLVIVVPLLGGALFFVVVLLVRAWNGNRTISPPAEREPHETLPPKR